MSDSSVQTCVRSATVVNPEGLHLRPADKFARLAAQFESSIEVSKGTERVDGKSIMSIIMLAAEQGSELSIHACGPDAESAAEALAELVNSGFAADAPADN